jgi:hypothetical protein
VLDEVRPHVLPTDAVIGIPDRLDLGDGPQVIDVPVRPCRRLTMMCDACPDSTRATGAANIDVKAGMDTALSKPTDLEGTGGGCGEE